MSSLELEPNQTNAYMSRRVLGNPEVPKVINFLIQKGIVKSSNQALVILVGLTVICFAAAGALVYKSYFSKPDIIPNAAASIPNKNAELKQ
ncbi:MAG: hypothetical protein V4576_02205 [Patescibacteria group bacterium]